MGNGILAHGFRVIWKLGYFAPFQTLVWEEDPKGMEAAGRKKDKAGPSWEPVWAEELVRWQRAARAGPPYTKAKASWALSSMSL